MRTTTRSGIVVAGLAGLLAGAAVAAEEDTGRYTMKPAENGAFIRLDKETGAMSVCSGKEGDWTCKPMPEAEAAARKRIEDLESENRALRADKTLRERETGKDEPKSDAEKSDPEKQADARGDTVPPDAPLDGPDVPPPPANLPIPTERDVDKLFDYVEGMVKKFKERIDRLEKEAKKDPATPL